MSECPESIRDLVYLGHLAHFGHGNIIRFMIRPFLDNEQLALYSKLDEGNCSWRDVDAWNAIKLRPEQVEKHDQTIINNWNARVKKGDRVYHLGDFAFCTPKRAHEILDQLNGNIHFIYGNHDSVIEDNKDVQERFVWCKDAYMLKVKDPDAAPHKQNIHLSHYAHKTWNKSHHGAWHLYGHSHGCLEETNINFCFKCGHKVAGETGLFCSRCGNYVRSGKSFDVGVDCLDFKPISYEEVKEKMAAKSNGTIAHHREGQ